MLSEPVFYVKTKYHEYFFTILSVCGVYRCDRCTNWSFAGEFGAVLYERARYSGH